MAKPYWSFWRTGWKVTGWVRWGDWIFEIKHERPLFSERNGFVRFRKIGFGHRIRLAKEPMKK